MAKKEQETNLQIYERIEAGGVTRIRCSLTSEMEVIKKMHEDGFELFSVTSSPLKQPLLYFRKP